MIDQTLLDILVCPKSQAPLTYHAKTNELWCHQSGLAYRIDDGIPVLLVNEARELTADELA